MNIETYKNIIDEADNKIMTGSIVTPQYVKLLSTLRLAVDGHRKMADRVNDMHRHFAALKQENADLRAEVASKENVVANIKREHRAEMNGARRQAGIWKSKAKRLEALKEENMKLRARVSGRTYQHRLSDAKKDQEAVAAARLNAIAKAKRLEAAV